MMKSLLANDPTRSALAGRSRRSIERRDVRRPIIVLQGFGCSNRVVLPLERRLRSALGRSTVRLESSSYTFDDIRVSAHAANGLVEALASRPGFEFVDIVGHSMGGLVAAYLLKHLDGSRRVRRVVTLGTPYRGTPAAVAGALLFGFTSRAIWQMTPGAPLLRELEAAPVPRGSELTSIGAQLDRVVPERRTLLEPSTRQRNFTIASANHVELLLSREVSTVIAEILSTPLDLDAGRGPSHQGTAPQAA